jgi:hypothetical protein
MKVFTGTTYNAEMIAALQERGYGRMYVDRWPPLYEGEVWAFDNRAYSDFLKGKQFDEKAYARRLDKAQALGTPYLAVLPDLVMQGARSLQFSAEWAERVQQGKWPMRVWYVAVQNRVTVQAVEDFLQSYDVGGVFVGGDDTFKQQTSRQWVELAHRHGRLCHIGRLGTPGKIRWGYGVGTDSFDSSFMLWTLERFYSTLRYIDNLQGGCN